MAEPAAPPAVWVDGSLVAAGDATVPAMDRGLLLGEGVFETFAVVDGVVFAVRRHLARLHRSLAAMELAVRWSDDELRAAVAEVAAGLGARGRGRVRLTVTASSAVVAAFPTDPWPPTATACTSPWPWNERSPLAGIKTTSRAELLRAMAHAQAQGCDEAISLTTDGRVCEGTGANVFLVVDGRLVTPALSAGCLPGVARALVLERTDAVEADVPSSALATCTEAFLTSSTRGVHPIAAIDGRALVAPGPLTAAAQLAYDTAVAADPDA